MRILLYGFGPYRPFSDNITARIIESLPAQSGLKKVIFPVRFDRRQFVDALGRHKPDVVLGLGQSSRKQIDVEMRAKNRRRARKSDRPRPILATRPQSLPTTLDIRAGQLAKKSTNAGDYVCNYSIYLMLDEIIRREMRIPLGFIHIPHDYDAQKARQFVLNVLQRCVGSRQNRR